MNHKPAPDAPPTWWEDLFLATIFLTRLPLRLPRPPDEGAHARAMAWFAVPGLLVGFISGGAYTLAAVVGLPPWPAALLALTAGILASGALHEDGLADTADGLGGGRDRAAKLEIMRDSRLGSYGGLALILSLGLRAGAVVALADPVLVAPALAASAAVSRAFIPLIAWKMNPARADGLAAAAGKPTGRNAASCLMMGAAAAVLLLNARALPAVFIAALAVLAVCLITRRHLQGYTGDTLGAAQQAAEIAFLLTLTVGRA
jgi:adenosylcobinamide-GDP ribazoletransferase